MTIKKGQGFRAGDNDYFLDDVAEDKCILNGISFNYGIAYPIPSQSLPNAFGPSQGTWSAIKDGGKIKVCIKAAKSVQAYRIKG